MKIFEKVYKSEDSVLEMSNDINKGMELIEQLNLDIYKVI